MRWVLVELEMVRMPDFVQCLDANLSFGCHDPVGKRMLLSSASATDMVADTFCPQAHKRVVELQRNQGVSLCLQPKITTSVCGEFNQSSCRGATLGCTRHKGDPL